MKPETRFGKWLRDRLKETDPSAHFSRVENSADPGSPDVSFCVDGVEGMAELKYTTRFPMGKKGLRPSQRIWIRRRLRAGGDVRLIVGTPLKAYLLLGSTILGANEYTEADIAQAASLTLYRSTEEESVRLLFLTRPAFPTSLTAGPRRFRPRQKQFPAVFTELKAGLKDRT